MIQQQQEQCEMQENDIPTTSTHTSDTLPPTPSRPNGRPPLTREHSIELKTPGLGSGDGFIHTTLCRLPLDCLSNDDVSLAQVHRLCRELTHTLSGHRMVISKFRFLETVGRGGLVRLVWLICRMLVYAPFFHVTDLTSFTISRLDGLFVSTVQSLRRTNL